MNMLSELSLSRSCSVAEAKEIEWSQRRRSKNV